MTPTERMLDVPGGRVWSGTYGGGPAIPLLVPARRAGHAELLPGNADRPRRTKGP